MVDFSHLSIRRWVPLSTLTLCLGGALAPSARADGSLVLALVGQSVNSLRVVGLDTDVYERWPRAGTFAIQRDTATTSLTVPILFGGTATKGVDYTTEAVNSVTFPEGVREVWVSVYPKVDASVEPAETIVLRLGSLTAPSAKMFLRDMTPTPTEEEATRFLLQAGFGADPETLADVMRMGFDRWIDDQFARPVGNTQPIIRAKARAGKPIYAVETKIALWEQVMRKRDLTTSPPSLPDPLRQRVAQALLQVFVISQNVDALLLNSEGVMNYYDRLLDGSFGNYRNLLLSVALHPCMGVYLSHVGNQKADPSLNRFPDENFAREVMQLFSIGLWELNQDGTRVMRNGATVPTYTNADIREFAKVFTGLQYGGPNNDSFQWAGPEYRFQMKMWDEFHDLGPKKLLNGLTLPARTFTPPDRGLAGIADVKAAIGNLSNHPNVGPFIGRLLIQRMVTSNPSPAYVSRVAAAFANNGAGVRGDMKAVVKAILLDPEARSYTSTTDPTFGKKREPYMTLFHLAKTFDAKSRSGKFDGASYMYDFFLQEPFQSPSVFNFYLPGYRPPGPMTAMGMAGPEFQIMTAVTALDGMNMGRRAIEQDISRWSPDDIDRIKLSYTNEAPLASNPDALVRRLALRMIGGPLNPRTFQIIRDATLKVPTTEPDWRLKRVKLAVYLVLLTAEYQIQR